MTTEESRDSGYEIIAASAVEVGLLKNGQGICTWWASEFGDELPGLDHPTIQHAIDICEGKLKS